MFPPIDQYEKHNEIKRAEVIEKKKTTKLGRPQSTTTLKSWTCLAVAPVSIIVRSELVFSRRLERYSQSKESREGVLLQGKLGELVL